MNKLKAIIILSTALLWSSLSSGQSIIDTSILFSQSNYGGSARVLGIGGSQVSLGGDVSSIVSNPAGLGMFNRSVISFSTGLNFITTRSGYHDTTTPDQKANVNIPNMSLVLYKELDSRYTEFKSTSFGVSYNRTNDFHQEYTYQGRGGNSMLDFFLDRAQGVSIQDFEDGNSEYFNDLDGLAARTFLIFPTSDEDPDNGFDDEYISDILGSPLQTEVVSIKGSQSQVSFSYGANYDDKLFLGGGVGLTSIDYSSTKTYEERDFEYNDPDDPDYINPLNSYTLEENLNISGGGINATLGLIFRPADFMQIGGSLTTPTYYSIDDEYDARLNVDYIDFNDEDAETDILVSNYSLITPLRVSGGATFFIGKYGFVSADIEMLNYGKNNIKSDDFFTLEDNQDISAKYGKSYNLKFGSEYRYDMFRFRAGYGHYAKPQIGEGSSRNVFSGGFGVRVKKYFLDLAVVNTQFSEAYSPYPLGSDTPVADINNSNTKGVITFGVNF